MRKGKHIIKVLFIAIAASLVLGTVIMLLWNALIPDLFNADKITFWQALGLFALTRILFGGYFKGFRDRHDMRREMHEKWEKMTPEERQALFESRRRHFKHWGESREEMGQPGN